MSEDAPAGPTMPGDGSAAPRAPGVMSLRRSRAAALKPPALWPTRRAHYAPFRVWLALLAQAQAPAAGTDTDADVDDPQPSISQLRRPRPGAGR